MDNLLEYIIPLIFAAIYFFGNMFAKSGSADEEETGPRRPLSPVEDPEAMERQRRIQEEIRRKIMARRSGAEDASPANVQPIPQNTEPQPMYREAEPAAEQRTSSQDWARDAEDKAAFSWDRSDDAYETQMQSRLREIEATNQRAAKLKDEAKVANERVNRRKASSEPTKRKRSGLLSGSVRESLKDPAAARAAFIYGEVLGAPISLRKESAVPGLTR